MTNEQQPKKSTAERFKEILERTEQEQKTRQDIVIAPKNVSFNEQGLFTLQDGRTFKVGDTALEHFSAIANIPPQFAAKLMKDKPDLLAATFNHYMQQDGHEKMFRIKNERVQGIVSPKYGRFDNHNMLETLWDKWNNKKEMPDFEIEGFHEADNYMHMRIVFPELSEKFGVSNEDGQVDIGRVAVDYSNSEIGYGRLNITPSIFRQVCLNGMKVFVADMANRLSKKHIYLNFDDTIQEIHLKTGNSIEEGRHILTKVKELKQQQVELPYAEIERLAKDFGMKEGKQISRLKECYLHEDEPTMFGIVNAFTRFARDVERVDGNNELRNKIEAYAGQMLMVSKR